MLIHRVINNRKLTKDSSYETIYSAISGWRTRRINDQHQIHFEEVYYEDTKENVIVKVYPNLKILTDKEVVYFKLSL